MKMNSFGRLFLTSCLLLSFGCLEHPAFQGGQLRKSRGPFFSTNYLVEFQELDLNMDGQYEVSFRGFPVSPVYLELYLLKGNNEQFIRQFTSEITMQLDRADGTLICKASGELNQHRGVGEHFWVLAVGGDEARFWNSDCEWLKIRRDQGYTLKISVHDSARALGALRAQPILWTPHD